MFIRWIREGCRQRDLWGSHLACISSYSPTSTLCLVTHWSPAGALGGLSTSFCPPPGSLHSYPSSPHSKICKLGFNSSSREKLLSSSSRQKEAWSFSVVLSQEEVSSTVLSAPSSSCYPSLSCKIQEKILWGIEWGLRDSKPGHHHWSVKSYLGLHWQGFSIIYFAPLYTIISLHFILYIKLFNLVHYSRDPRSIFP